MKNPGGTGRRGFSGGLVKQIPDCTVQLRAADVLVRLKLRGGQNPVAQADHVRFGADGEDEPVPPAVVEVVVYILLHLNGEDIPAVFLLVILGGNLMVQSPDQLIFQRLDVQSGRPA